MRRDHDSQYKDLFSNSTLVAELLRSFIAEEFVQHLDFSTLKKVNAHFVTGKYRKREADIIYEMQFKKNPIYIFLLLEFQSTVDKFMSLRLLEYICQFYKDLQKALETDLLPPVFPLVLYSGDKQWSAPVQFRDLVAPSTMPGRYVPDFRYYKIAVNEISTERLAKIRNAVASIFFVEKSSPGELAAGIKQFVELVKSEKPEVIQVVTDWLSSMQGLKFPKKQISSITDLTEVTTMWATAVKEHDSNVKRRAILSERQHILVDLMGIKFRPSEKANRRVLATTDATKLDRALKAVVAASSRDEVLKCRD
jgi:hypothetical protein